MQRLILFLAYLSITGLAFGQSSLPPRSEIEDPICGIKSYVNKADESCGIESYNEAIGVQCGEPAFKLGQSLACPGSKRSKDYERKVPGCESGDFYLKSRTVCGRGLSGDCEVLSVCVASRNVASCRLPEFGKEPYNKCRHPDFGVEKYKSCRKAEFGVESYNTCSLHLKPEQVEGWMISVKSDISRKSQLLLNSQAQYLAQYGYKKRSYCLIEAYSDDPLYEEIVKRLKTEYTINFGEFWLPRQDDYCANDSFEEVSEDELRCNELDIEAVIDGLSDPNLSAADIGFFNACQSKKIYDLNFQWFNDKAADVDRLLDDLPAKKDPAIKEKLEKLKKDILGGDE